MTVDVHRISTLSRACLNRAPGGESYVTEAVSEMTFSDTFPERASAGMRTRIPAEK
jgi:hypothetical protein